MMSRVRSWIGSLAGVCTVLLAAGCGTSLVPVKGIVTFDNKPLAHASVMFISQEPGGRDASGSTDAHGVFELSTYQHKDGAMPGLYKVTIHYSEPRIAPPGHMTPADVQKAAAKAGTPSKPSIVIPPTYSQPDKTKLSQRVPADGEVRFDLKSAHR
jgi:hypothetical protein